MPDQFLLVSNPPHGTPDPARAAEGFGVSVAEARMRLNFVGPEVWATGSDVEAIKRQARALMEAGAKVRLVRGRSLTILADRLPLRSFAFEPDGLRCTLTTGRELMVPYDWRTTLIPCRPTMTDPITRRTVWQTARAAKRNKSLRQEAKERLSAIKDVTDESFVDVYFFSLPHVRRFTMRPGVTEFSGLGDAMKPIASQNYTQFVTAVKTRFQEAAEDTRLRDAPLPRVVSVGGRALEAVLADIDPALRNLDPYDLQSRLAFLSRV